MAFDFNSYFENIAVSLKEILHTTAKPAFFKASSLANIEEFLQAGTKKKDIVLIIIDAPEGNYIDHTSDNIMDNQVYNYFVMQRVAPLDMVARSAALKLCQVISKKITSKLFRDKQNDSRRISPLTGLRNLEKGNISYVPVGPFGDNYHGISNMFSLLESPGITYNADDWETIS